MKSLLLDIGKKARKTVIPEEGQKNEPCNCTSFPLGVTFQIVAQGRGAQTAQQSPRAEETQVKIQSW